MVIAELYRRQTLMPPELLEPLTLAEVADVFDLPRNEASWLEADEA